MGKGKRKASRVEGSEDEYEDEYEDELASLRPPSKRRTPDKESSGFTQVSPTTKALLRRRDGYECWVCGDRDSDHLEVAHIIPRSNVPKVRSSFGFTAVVLRLIWCSFYFTVLKAFSVQSLTSITSCISAPTVTSPSIPLFLGLSSYQRT